MEISPRVEIGDCCGSEKQHYEREQYADGHRVATEFVCKADQRNVVNAVKVSFSWGPPLDRGYASGVHETATGREAVTHAQMPSREASYDTHKVTDLPRCHGRCRR